MSKYEVFDIRQGLGSCPVFEAKNARHAVQLHLDSIQDNNNFKRSGENNVVLKATKFIERDGERYQIGNACWFEIIE